MATRFFGGRCFVRQPPDQGRRSKYLAQGLRLPLGRGQVLNLVDCQGTVFVGHVLWQNPACRCCLHVTRNAVVCLLVILSAQHVACRLEVSAATMSVHRQCGFLRCQ